MNLRMASHTGFGRRNTREITFFDRRVTITAIDSQLTYVVAVAEWNGLFAHHLSLGHIRRSFNSQENPKSCGYDKYSAKNAYLGKRICAGMKKLGHLIEKYES